MYTNHNGMAKKLYLSKKTIRKLTYAFTFCNFAHSIYSEAKYLAIDLVVIVQRSHETAVEDADSRVLYLEI